MSSSKRAWSCMSTQELQRVLGVSPRTGLSSNEVRERTTTYGRNEFSAGKDIGLWGRVLGQFKSALVLILLGAGVIHFYISSFHDKEAIVDTIVIFIVLCINVIVGALQEERASRAFAKLNASQERKALVLREGVKQIVPARTLVPGDVVFLQAGYHIPADVRIVQEKDLQINESVLTGEWVAVSKDAEPLPKKTAQATERNMAFMGTLIESGKGVGLVVRTGSATSIGEIAGSLCTIHEQVTPLQESIRRIAHFLSYVVAGMLVCIMILGYVRGERLEEMFMIAVAVAVATIPAGLPAAVTVVLAVGMEAILKKGGLVRSLLATETLGATTIILTDKTGTLTQSSMNLAGLWTHESIQTGKPTPTGDNHFLLELGVLESDAFLEEDTTGKGAFVVHGRPLEKALMVSGLEVGIVQEVLLKEQTRLDRLEFSSDKRFGASLHADPHRRTSRLIIAGAPELLLEKAEYLYHRGKRIAFSDALRASFLEKLSQETATGKRVIALAYRDMQQATLSEKSGVDLFVRVVFAGLVTFEDPVRPDVNASIREVREAGARVIMLTGDNLETALYVAKTVGIATATQHVVLSGSDIDEMSDRELFSALQTVAVIARALPAHKLRIVQVLRDNGEVVAMTGDGINDAPALRAASIGLAVGSGTEVAKEASDLILINDSFSIIVNAVGEGRRIMANLKKIIAYFLSTNFSEIFLIGGALIGGVPVPLVPAQILWANIVEGGLMSFPFALEPREKGIMKQDPRSASSQRILTKELRHMILLLSIVTGSILVGLYYVLLYTRGEANIDEIRTILFVTLSLDALCFSFSLKSLYTPIWRIAVFNNRYLLATMTLSIGLLVCALTWQPLMTLLSLVPLTYPDILLLVGVGVLNLLSIEVLKWRYFVRPVK